jgi:quercetin dioxygenase-like cupin family protein
MRMPIVLLALSTVLLVAADDRGKVDNDSVRIVKAVDQPHKKGSLHQHTVNRVMIYLDAGDITLVSEDGRKDAQHWKAGQVAWSPAGGKHTSENVGDSPIRIVEIELKKPAPSIAPARRPDLDPVKIDAKHNVLLFENDQVRVFRSWREAGKSEPMHEHAGTGRIAVLLTDMDARVKTQDGKETALRGSAGDSFWSGPVIHSTTNIGPQRIEMIVVEVK